MTTLDKARRFLADRPGVDYCDPCLAREIGADCDEVERAARELARLPLFLRDAWRCGRCRTAARVTRSLGRIQRLGSRARHHDSELMAA